MHGQKIGGKQVSLDTHMRGFPREKYLEEQTSSASVKNTQAHTCWSNMGTVHRWVCWHHKMVLQFARQRVAGHWPIHTAGLGVRWQRADILDTFLLTLVLSGGVVRRTVLRVIPTYVFGAYKLIRNGCFHTVFHGQQVPWNWPV